MDHQRMSCILPSNAPALAGRRLHDSTIPSGVLQERCSNRQDDLSDLDIAFRKGETSRNDSVFFNDIRLNSYTDFEKKTPAQIISKSNKLWHEFLQCDAFKKYHKRPSKDAPPLEAKSIWPEHMEIAFCRALVYFPPIGRKKVTSTADSKLRGRNELIAEKIQLWTGEKRTRKQVSSHIQVLKPMVKDNKFIMQHLAGNEDDKRSRNRHNRANSSVYRRPYGHSMMQHQRCLPATLNSTPRSQLHGGLASPFNSLSAPVSRSHINTHMPFQFDMFVRNTDTDSLSAPLHNFTTLRESNAKLADIHISDTAHLFQNIPQLTSVELENLYKTQIIMAESTLKLMSGSLSKNAELGIQFELQTQASCDLNQYENFECSTRFFEAGKPLNKVTVGPIDYDRQYNRLGNVQFGSKFWAAKVMEVARRLRESREYRKRVQGSDSREEAIALEDAARRIEYEIRAQFLALTALQELTAIRKGNGERITLLLVCWKFEQTSRNCCGETTWRNVLLIPQPQQQQQMIMKEDNPKNEFEHMDLGLSQHDTSMGLQPPFEAQQSFDLNDLSTMALVNMASDPHNTQLYPANDVDFTGGHIHMCLAPDITMAAAVSLDPFHEPLQDVSDSQSQILYDNSQQWQPTSYSNPYFDQASTLSQLRAFTEGTAGHANIPFEGNNNNTHSTTPFDGTNIHTTTPFDGQNAHVVASFREGDREFAQAGASHVNDSAEEPLPSIEFMG
ncbi:hypothetical protein EJ08DRAFT_345539 [Tothia fuscella]|uniref:TEA domain-containing protein n=1 Tax=Tothia fuscella TaxID=1048955 RepID=A0A9P4P2I1_9PEZI|nr:hypothetical protein EJ08DRAFT_345539 [Tothia fuscella]